MKCNWKFLDPSGTFDETRACLLPTKSADTKNNRTKKLHVSDNVEAREGQLAHWAMHRKKNCSIIQRLCATHSIKLTDPLKSRIKIVAIKSSEHQHERDIQMMGSDKSSGLYQLREAGKEFPLNWRVREKINRPNICYVFANSTFVAICPSF